MRRRIGSGGFATVWLCYDESLDSPVAVKVLADNWAGDFHVRQRFVEEGRFLRKVESPHVVPVYDAGELDDGRPYLVMAYADQGNLGDRLDLSPLPVGQALTVIRQTGDGLQALHQRGVLHRDVKPGNVLFRTVEAKSGQTEVRAMVGDLGLGKALDMSSRLTMVAGTPSYVSPEQARGEGLDARSDQYSLAALTYLVLAGRPPFSHATLGAAAAPGPPEPLGDHLPPAVDAVVRRGLAPDREDRFPDIAAYLTALDRAVEGVTEARPSAPQAWIPVDPELTQPGPRPTSSEASSTLPPPPGATRRARWPWLVAAALALAAGIGVGVAVQRHGDGTVTVRDDDGSLEVTVPRSWAGVQATDGWTPPGESQLLPALSVGSAADWQQDPGTQGVFLGVEPGDTLPELLPGHPECATTGDPLTDAVDGDPMVTVVHTGCGSQDGVVIERVRQVADSRQLWIQVRSDDRATANVVLDSVTVLGM